MFRAYNWPSVYVPDPPPRYSWWHDKHVTVCGRPLSVCGQMGGRYKMRRSCWRDAQSLTCFGRGLEAQVTSLVGPQLRYVVMSFYVIVVCFFLVICGFIILNCYYYCMSLIKTFNYWYIACIWLKNKI